MYNHNAPPLANLGPVLNNGNSQNGGSGNWNESQRMRGKIRYGSRNANNSRHQNQQQQHSNNSSSGYGGSSIPQINNMKTSGVPVNNVRLYAHSQSLLCLCFTLIIILLFLFPIMYFLVVML